MVKNILRITARHYPFGYQELYEHLYEETTYGKKLNKNSFSATLSRMKKKGLLITKDSKFAITPEGRLYLTKSIGAIKSFFNTKTYRDNKDKSKKLIVIFDIPEKLRFYRDWLRGELVGFGFTMIQKSVWFGPGVPKEFVEYLNECGIMKCIRFFHTTEKDLI